MRTLIRYFFRALRLILTPIVLIAEKLTTPNAIARSTEDQHRVDAICQQLALYQFKACPFCIKVRKEISRLGLNIELRDAQHVAKHREDLNAGGGAIKVPCLVIDGEDGKKTWMYESNDIIAWLNAHCGPATPNS
ncbi:MAG: glutathione S-transferase N-terminal domain-containing protein [Alcanivoracaceae bacterium]|nr:glutathione S-transferase N-terminal domain-containing protein [Alcanivoracaceae bacterium]